MGGPFGSALKAKSKQKKLTDKGITGFVKKMFGRRCSQGNLQIKYFIFTTTNYNVIIKKQDKVRLPPGLF